MTLPWAILLLSGAALAGCAAPIVPRVLDRVVLDYDEAVARGEAGLILLNVARAHRGRPLHFTTVTGVAATFEYRLDAAVGGEIVGRPDPSLLAPALAAGASENPTISIVPFGGEEFTRRTLTPVEATKLKYFVERGEDPGTVLALLGRAILVEAGGRVIRYRNDPARPDERGEFERIVRHLSEIGREDRLYVDLLVFTRRWPVPSPEGPSATEFVEALQAGYRFDRTGDGLTVAGEVVGRVVVTDYDPAALTDEAREALNESAERHPAHTVLVDVGPAEGRPAFRGRIALRSFHDVIEFVAADIGSGAASPLGVVVTKTAPRDAAFSVEYGGRYYSIPGTDAGAPDREAFELVYQLFQMTVTDIGPELVPPVTISK